MKKHPGCLGYVGDDILPSYIGIMINHYNHPHYQTRIQCKAMEFFFMAQVEVISEIESLREAK